jgi:hypothetical protein
MTLSEFVAAQGIKFSAKWIAERTDGLMLGLPNNYRCQIRKGRRSMVVYFSQGSSCTTAPTCEEVLGCVANDVHGFENADSFEDWCSMYGYDTDSRRAEKTYKAVERQATALARVLNDSDAYKTLLFGIEGA